jgi:hypothetical protein
VRDEVHRARPARARAPAYHSHGHQPICRIASPLRLLR